jgi:hypothetical protein
MPGSGTGPDMRPAQERRSPRRIAPSGLRGPDPDRDTYTDQIAARAPYQLKRKDGPDTDGYQRLACPATGAITQNVSGSLKLILNADGSTIWLGKGIEPFGLSPADQAHLGLPGLFIFAGALTATTAPDGSTTSLTLHGHMVINVCAALS